MNEFWLNYIFYLCLAGWIFMFLLSIMAFFCSEYLKLNKDTNIKSGISLLITSGVIIKEKLNLSIYYFKIDKFCNMYSHFAYKKEKYRN